MVRRGGNEYEWAKMLYEKCWLDRDDADYYASKLVRHDLAVDDLPDLTQSVLRDIGIHKMGHVLSIMKHVKEFRAQMREKSRSRSSSTSSRSVSRTRKRSRSSTSSPVRKPTNNRRRKSRSRSRDRSRSRERRRPSPRRMRPKSPPPPSRRRSPSPPRRRRERTRTRSPPRRQRSRTRSPRRKDPRRRSRSRSNHRNRRSVSVSPPRNSGNVAHIDRTSRRGQNGKVQLDDEDLLTANIELPARFKSKNKKSTILRSAQGSGGPKIRRTFTEDDDMARRLGLEVDKQTQSLTPSDKYLYVHPQKQRTLSMEEQTGMLKIDVKGGPIKYKIAERPKNETNVFARLGSSMKDDKETNKADKLMSVEHKEGRYGRSEGIFSLDDGDNSVPNIRSRLGKRI